MATRPRPRPNRSRHRELRSEPNSSEPAHSYGSIDGKYDYLNDSFMLDGRRNHKNNNHPKATSPCLSSQKLLTSDSSGSLELPAKMEKMEDLSLPPSATQFKGGGKRFSNDPTGQQLVRKSWTHSGRQELKNKSKSARAARQFKHETQIGVSEFGGSVESSHSDYSEENNESERSLSFDFDEYLQNSNTDISLLSLPGVRTSGIEKQDSHRRRSSLMTKSESSRRREMLQQDDNYKRRQVNLMLDTVKKCSFKKKLYLSAMNLKPCDIPVNDICCPPLTTKLHTLHLACNIIPAIPDPLVMELKGLHTMDLQQCGLLVLPPKWNLPVLKKLNLSHNELHEFPDEKILKGLPSLEHLNMYGNKVSQITFAKNMDMITLESLNLGYNDITALPDNFHHIFPNLKKLEIMNNLVTHISRDICKMSLKTLNTTMNPLIQPPLDTCEQGIHCMRRYYATLLLEEKKILWRKQKLGRCEKKPVDPHDRYLNKKKKHRLPYEGVIAEVRRESVRRETLQSLIPAVVSVRTLEKSLTPPRSLSMELEGIYVTPPLNIRRARDRAISCGGEIPDLSPVNHITNESGLRGSIHSVPNIIPAPDFHGPPKGIKKNDDECHIDFDGSIVVSEYKCARGLGKPKIKRKSKLGRNTNEYCSCGVKTFKKKWTGKLKPLNIEGQVRNGRCLSCNPEPVSRNIVNDVRAIVKSRAPVSCATRSLSQEILSKRGASVSIPANIFQHGADEIDIIEPRSAQNRRRLTAVTFGGESDRVGASREQHSQYSLPTFVNDSRLISKSDTESDITNEIAINDTLKVIILGMPGSGKTSIVERLINGKEGILPQEDERTIGVDIYDWQPKNHNHFEDKSARLNTHIQIEDEVNIGKIKKGVDIRISLWDFAGQNVYYATHELFFSQRALYVIVWDMAAKNRETRRKRATQQRGDFQLNDSSDEDDDEMYSTEEMERADNALNKDIDEKVQFWIDCIQSRVPGAVILPVASFDDCFSEGNSLYDEKEAKRRCNTMKQRILQREKRRTEGIAKRLKKLVYARRADTEAADQLRRLQSPFYRPKIIFGFNDGDDCVIRVSCTKYSGFDVLRNKIISVGTGRDHDGFNYPLFRGHVGARIPRTRVEVRDVIRELRSKKFFVIEREHFIKSLKESGVDIVEDLDDSLAFLSDTGELSYFGCRKKEQNENLNNIDEGPELDSLACDDRSYDDRSYDSEDFDALAFPDDCGHCQDDKGLSNFIFLNPRLLAEALKCILRHNLSQVIKDTRRSLGGRYINMVPPSFDDARVNCPIISAEDACMLWDAQKKTSKAASKAVDYAEGSLKMTPFEFLQRLFVHFNVFVPIDLSIDKAFLGGKEYGGYDGPCNLQEGNESGLVFKQKPEFFFLPSLLGPGEPSQIWTYKCHEAWKTTLCHSWLFPDGIPPGMMERITATVLRNVNAAARHEEQNDGSDIVEVKRPLPPQSLSQQFNKRRILKPREVLCWHSSFLLRLDSIRENKKAAVEVFVTLADKKSALCLGSDELGAGERRLIVSGNGPISDWGVDIWEGGYALIMNSVEQVVQEYGGLEFEKQGICPECLEKDSPAKARNWSWTDIRSAVKREDRTIRCKQGHRVDMRYICRIRKPPSKGKQNSDPMFKSRKNSAADELIRGVVLVALWDEKTKKLLEAGSGFVVCAKRGLIVTAAHTLMDINSGDPRTFGKDYKGNHFGKVVIGVIPKTSRDGGYSERFTAVYRYFAEIVAKDEAITKKHTCEVDACVLRITTKFENDVGGQGDGIADQVQTVLMNNKKLIKKEHLKDLKMSETPWMEERVRVFGYNQGGEGLVSAGAYVNRCADMAEGYVCKIFQPSLKDVVSYRLRPVEEIVVNCPTIGGHSGGPAVNEQGEVIGILSRADASNQFPRCYLVPASRVMCLVDQAKEAIRGPNTSMRNLFDDFTQFS